MLTATNQINLPRVRQHCLQWLWHKTGKPETETSAVGLHLKSHSWGKSRIFNSTLNWFWVSSGSWAVPALPVQRRSALLFACSSCPSKLERKRCPQGTIACSGLRESRSWPPSSFTSKVRHMFKVSYSNMDLCCCSRNNCSNARVISGLVPPSPEVCWNTCYLKHQPGPTAVFCTMGYIWTNNFDYIFREKRIWTWKKKSQSFHRKKETLRSLLDYLSHNIIRIFTNIITTAAINYSAFLAQHKIVSNAISKTIPPTCFNIWNKHFQSTTFFLSIW